MTTIVDDAAPHAGHPAQVRINTKNGSAASRHSWAADRRWVMRRRIFNAQDWRMSPAETQRLHEWIDAFAQQTETTEQHGGSVSTPPQRVDRGCHTNDGRP